MTIYESAAGSITPGGESDGRSTATVDGILRCDCGANRLCSTCGDNATIRFGSDVYCDIHGGDLLRSPILRLLLQARNASDFGGVVGQATFVKFHPYYDRRARLDAPFRTQAFRFGHVTCANCGATWIGVEHSLCEWCYDRAVARRWSNGERRKAAS